MKLLRKYVCLVLAALVLCAAPAGARKPDVSRALSQPELYSIIYQQSSAEYKALCLQTYNAATSAMRELLRLGEFEMRDGKACAKTLVKVGEGKYAYEYKPLAVVLDLDETVLDNSGFEAWCVLTGHVFEPKNWGAWGVFQGAVPAAQRSVPGAVDFLLECQKMGITPIYITDRDESMRPGTLATLRGLGLDTPDLNERLILRKKGDDEARAQALLASMGVAEGDALYARTLANLSKKAGRRLEVSKDYQIVAFCGDNLYDHDVFVNAKETDAAKIRAQRNDEVAKAHRYDWGTRFFLLPCPMYGGWLNSVALPSDRLTDGLDDFGFQQWMVEQQRAARTMPSNKPREIAPARR